MSETNKTHFYDKDKEYFIKLGLTIKEKWKQTIILSIGVVSLSVVLFLKILTGLISDQLAPVICAAIVLLVGLAWAAIIKRPKSKAKKETKPHNFNCVSLGVLYFSFALSLWTNKTADDWPINLITIIISIISVIFFIGVYSELVRNAINKNIAPWLLSLTTLAIFVTFIFGLLSVIEVVPSPILDVIFYFGFLWLVTYLLVIYRDVIWEPVRVWLMIDFIVVAGILYRTHDAVGIIGGTTLLVIFVLCYGVATKHITPNGSLED